MNNKITRTITALLAVLFLALGITACSTEADTVNKNLDRDAEAFRVFREISFVNGITGEVLVKVRGFCSLEYGGKIDVTCKEDGKFFRNTLGAADNAFVVSQQLDRSSVSDTHYQFVIRPGTIVPDIDVR